MLINGYYGAPMEQQNGFMQEAQFNAEGGCAACAEYGVPNQEAAVQADGFQPGLLQTQPEQTAQEIVTEKSPGKAQLESDEEDDDEDDELGGWGATKKGMNGRAVINFFPVMFGRARGGQGRSEGFPAGTVAIANSYSTGRKGVATSNANAYADPAGPLRNMYRNENPQIGQY